MMPAEAGIPLAEAVCLFSGSGYSTFTLMGWILKAQSSLQTRRVSFSGSSSYLKTFTAFQYFYLTAIYPNIWI